MLRSIIAGIAIAFVVGAWALTLHDPAGWPALVVALLIAGACLFERRYHAKNSGISGDRFGPTGERFVDPETGRVMAVWSDPATGARRYVDEGEPPSPAV